MRIIFMGTPHFAVYSLKALLEAKFNIVAVITSVDKQAGRGLKLKHSPVKEFALSKNLTILQPPNLKSPKFLEELKSYNADLQIVVAFRILPELVWAMPKYGTFNLHASLLPDYRGAAPINWVIIKGEKISGVTTFFLDKDIDTGKIIEQRTVRIEPNETAGSLHDKLMVKGAELVVNTTKLIEAEKVIPETQKNPEIIKPAPKLTKENTKIDWDLSPDELDRLVKGLNPYPLAWTTLNGLNVKIYSLKIIEIPTNLEPINLKEGVFHTDHKLNFGKIKDNKFLNFADLKLEGKKRMTIDELLRGYKF